MSRLGSAMNYRKMTAADWLAHIGGKGGSANTIAQRKARAENGKKGGRPRKRK